MQNAANAKKYMLAYHLKNRKTVFAIYICFVQFDPRVRKIFIYCSKIQNNQEIPHSHETNMPHASLLPTPNINLYLLGFLALQIDFRWSAGQKNYTILEHKMAQNHILKQLHQWILQTTIKICKWKARIHSKIVTL